MTWVPYDGVYPLRGEEGWLMAPDPEPVAVRDYRHLPLPEAINAAFDDIREELRMAPDKPIDDLEDDAPDVPNDDVTVETKTTISQPSENDDDTEEEKK